MKRNAFTLFEMLTAMVIVSLVIVVIIRGISGLGILDKGNSATLYKMLSDFSQLSMTTLNKNPKHFPTGNYIQRVAGTWEYMPVSDTGEILRDEELINIYSQYAKFKEKNIDFCKNTDCTRYGLGLSNAERIKGIRWFSDAYLGIWFNPENEQTGLEIHDCPNYVMPEIEGEITPSHTSDAGRMDEVPKCWALLLIDTNGSAPPNEKGKDIFVFGLGETDVVK